MQKSETIAEIAKALSKFQGAVKQPLKDKDNPFFKSKYVPLESVVEAITTVAAKHGLSFTQFPINDDNRVGVFTVIMHESGEWIESPPIYAQPAKQDAQGIGAVITYLKRYSLSAAFGITSDEDDDGNSAGHNNMPSNGQNGANNARNNQRGTNTTNNQNNADKAKLEAIKAKYKKLTGSLKTYPTFEKAMNDKKYNADKINQLIEHNLATQEKFGGPIAIICSANGKDPEETQSIIENFLSKGLTFEQVLQTLEAAAEKKQKEAEGKSE